MKYIQRKALAKWQKFAMPAVCCIALLTMLTVAGSVAWFTAHDRIVNQSKMPQQAVSVTGGGAVENGTTTAPHPTYPDFDAELVDVFTPPATLAPSVSIEKRVGAQNNKTIPAFVRLIVLPSIVMADGKTVLPAKLGEQVLITDLNTTDWRAGGDGFYYYLHMLQPGESTDVIDKNLFNHVQLAAGLPADYDGALLKIEVKCEAVRAYKWDYRQYWWDSASAPVANPLQGIDTALAALL
jgi:hypothetical protein